MERGRFSSAEKAELLFVEGSGGGSGTGREGKRGWIDEGTRSCRDRAKQTSLTCRSRKASQGARGRRVSGGQREESALARSAPRKASAQLRSAFPPPGRAVLPRISGRQGQQSFGNVSAPLREARAVPLAALPQRQAAAAASERQPQAAEGLRGLGLAARGRPGSERSAGRARLRGL